MVINEFFFFFCLQHLTFNIFLNYILSSYEQFFPYFTIIKWSRALRRLNTSLNNRPNNWIFFCICNFRHPLKSKTPILRLILYKEKSRILSFDFFSFLYTLLTKKKGGKLFLLKNTSNFTTLFYKLINVSPILYSNFDIQLLIFWNSPITLIFTIIWNGKASGPLWWWHMSLFGHMSSSQQVHRAH